MPHDFRYDRQLIVMFHCGNSHDVKVVKEGAKELNKRGQNNKTNTCKSHIATAPTSAECATKGWDHAKTFKDELRKLTFQSRLYIYGHCDWAEHKVGTYTGAEMANLLNYCGLLRVKLISIVACKAARNYQVGFKINCFASHFLERLQVLCMDTVVYARTNTTGVFPEEAGEEMAGRKWTRPDSKSHDQTVLLHQSEYTKWKFTYANGKVQQEVVKYRGAGED